jgi:membrane protein YqaA with SNARE-associated domain
MSTDSRPDELTFADGVTTPKVYERLGPKVWVLGGVMVVTAIVTLVLMLREFTSESYLYLLFYAIPANSAISVFPHEPVVIYYGKMGGILLTASAATLGTLIAGYLDHSVFVPVMNLQSLSAYKKKRWYRRAAGLYMRFPFLTLVVAGFTPIPFFPFKFLSFSVHYQLWRYLAALLTGRFPRYVALAWLGHVVDIPNWALFGFFGVVILAYAAKAVPQAVAQIRDSRGAAGTGNGTVGSDES